MFDYVFSNKVKNRQIINIATAVGHAIEAECQMSYYDKEAPALLATLKKNYWHEARGTEYKRKCIQTLMHKTQISPWSHWDVTTKVKVGTFLMDCLMEVSGWFERDLLVKGRKTISILVPTETLIKHHDEIMRCAEL